MRNETALALIERIYDAALDPSHLPQALTGLGEALGGVQECLFAETPGLESFGMIAPRRDHAFVSSFYEYWFASEHDTGWPLLARNLVAMPAGQMLDIRELMDVASFSRTEFYNEWWRPQGLGQAALIIKFATRRGGWGIYGVHRSRKGDDFDAEDIELLTRVAPHLARAVSLQHELACLTVEEACSDAVASNDKGILLIDAAARVVFANGVAESWFESEDGLRLENSRLTVGSPVVARQLGRRIASCVERTTRDRGPGGALAVPRRGQRPLLIDVIPFRSQTTRRDLGWLGLLSPVAMLVITDPERERRRRRAQLQERFELTPAEAEFALEILRGDGREAAAGRLGISLSTARTHLTRIFSKTGVCRQAELVYLLSPLN